MTIDEMKKWIKEASYEELLSKWRNADCGSPFFQGELGQFYSDEIKWRRAEIDNARHVQISKDIGWNK